MPKTEPVLSLLFPLYRSAPFVPNLLLQLNQLTNPAYEIIISDRHCEDNAIEVLYETFSRDERFRFIRAKDKLNWVGHYNILLQEASAKYFCWVPHDDAYQPDFFSLLIEKMEQSPSAISAFATMNAEEKKDWVPDYSIFKTKRHYPFSTNEYVQLYRSGLLGIPFRGVFRRHVIVRNKLWIRQHKRVATYQDMYWIFALLLHGGFVYSDETSCTKRYKVGTAHSGWKITSRSKRNPYVLRLLFAYLFASPLSFFAKTKLVAGILVPDSLSGKFQKR